MPRSKVLTVTEVAKLLRCHQTTIYRLLAKGAIPTFKVGSDYRFHVEAIEQWIERGGWTNTQHGRKQARSLVMMG